MKLSLKTLGWWLCLTGLPFLGACSIRQGMYNQAKYKPLAKNPFFADKRASRMPIDDTVARGELREDDLFYRGLENGKPSTEFPFAITKQDLERGRERFDIYCSVCHGLAGRGDGMVVRRGFQRPPSLHDDRLRTVTVGHIFQVITNGFGAMPNYAAPIDPADRWRIVAYIRALQVSEHASIDDVPAEERGNLR